MANNFSVIEVRTGAISNTSWASDYLDRAVYQDWPITEKINKDATVKEDFLGESYGCDETLLLESTTSSRHVDLSLSLVPKNPKQPDKFKIAMAGPGATSAIRKNFDKKRIMITDQMTQNQNLFDELVLLPMDIFGESLSPTNFIVFPEAAKIILSLPKYSSKNDLVKATMETAFPLWNIEAIEMTTNWRGGIHCMTGQLTKSMFKKILNRLGQYQMGTIA